MITCDTAESYLKAGFCVLPAHEREKRPTVAWKAYQKQAPTLESAKTLFPAPRMCVLCGEVSGNLELLDFDDAGSQYQAFCESLEDREDILQRCFFERSPSGGYHIAYRCTEPVETSQKLARKPDGAVLIETRGEGGLFLCSPSEGYTPMSDFDLIDVGVLSMEEREVLLSTARALDQFSEIAPDVAPDGAGGIVCGIPFSVPAPVSLATQQTGTDNSLIVTPSAGVPAWEDFNQRGDVRPILISAGWKPIEGGTRENEEWTRPGKLSGVSATLKVIDGVPFFHVFSSNAMPFEANKSYTPFQVYALLEHGGDHSSSAGALRLNGWGKNIETLDFSDLTCGGKSNREEEEDPAPELAPEEVTEYVPPTIPEHLYNVPGVMGDVMEYCAMYAPRPQRPFALATALSLMSLACNQQWASHRGLRANVYLMAVGPTGCGKEFGRALIKNIFRTLGLSNLIRETYASLPGLQNDLRFGYNPRLWLMDEMGRTLQALSAKVSNPSAKELWPGLLRLYTSSNSSYKPAVKADVPLSGDAYDDIEYPFLSLYGTSTPEQILNAMTWSIVEDGFLGRVMAFEAEPLPPDYVPSLQEDAPPPFPDYGLRSLNASIDVVRTTNEPPVAQCVPESPEAFELFQNLLIKQDSEQRKSGRMGQLWARCEEQAEKLALLYAYSYSNMEPEIDEESARWGCELSEYLTRRRVSLAQDWISENDFDQRQKEVLRYIKEHGGVVTKTDLARRFQCHNSKTREEIIDNLVQSKAIRAIVTKGATKNKTSYKII